MKDYIAFLCDNVDENLYGKYNFTGVNLSDEIQITYDNYLMITKIVFIKNSLEESLSEKKISLILNVKDITLNDLIFEDVIFENSLPNGFTQNDNKLILIIPAQLILSSNTLITFNFEINDSIVLEQRYKVKLGNAPYVNTNGEMLFNGVIIPSKYNFDVKKLFARSISNLFIIDQFIDPDSFIDLCSLVDKNCSIRILTVNKCDNKKRCLFIDKYQELIDLGFSKIEVRFTPNIHDRYVLIEDTELYHFGHSLKDLNKDKISSYELISNKENFERLSSFFENQWNASECDMIRISND